MKNTKMRFLTLLLVFNMIFTSLAIAPFEVMAQELLDISAATTVSDRHVPSATFELERQYAIERLARESAEFDFLTSTLAAPVGLQGFEGDYELDNPNEIVEIIVQFITPPTVVLEHLQERDNSFIRALSQVSFEEQALSAHARFNQQLMQLPMPFSLTAQKPEIFSEHHQLFNGVYMRMPAGMVEIIASLPEVFAVTPHIIPTIDIPLTTDTSVIHNVSGVSTSPFFHNPNLMRTARTMFDIDYIHSEMGITGNGVRVGMLDTGIYSEHPEFVRQLDSTGRVPGWQYYELDDAPGSHGTLTAGSIIAMAPEIELWSFRRVSHGHSGMLDIEALEAAHKRGMDVIYTWGGPYNHPFSAFAYAVTTASLDTVVVVAAHNFGPDPFTVLGAGNSPTAITIGAGWAGNDIDIWEVHLWEFENWGTPIPSSGLDEIADFSGRGPVRQTYHIKLDIIAPGMSAISTTACGGYSLFGGTSMAGPVAAGIAALLVEAFPNAEPWEIRARMMNTARPLDDMPNASVFTVGSGFVRPLEALTSQSFATVRHNVPLDECPATPFSMYHMASLSFGEVFGSASTPLTVTIHNPGFGTWTPQVIFNGNHAGVNLNIASIGGNSFAAHMTFASQVTSGLFEGNLIFTNLEGRKITMPFAVNFRGEPHYVTESFTDPSFLAAIREITNRPAPLTISKHHVENITSLWISDRNIANLNGIEHFTALETLDVSHNQLTSLDVSNNLALVRLWVHDNNMTSPGDVIGWEELGLIEGEWDGFIFWSQRAALPSNLTVVTNNPNWGDVFATGQLLHGNSFVIIDAKPKDGYVFERWEVIAGNVTINNINSSWTFFSASDITAPTQIQAIFLPSADVRTITVSARNPEWGNISASHTFAEPSQVVNVWTTASSGATIDGHTSNMDLVAVDWHWAEVTPTFWHTTFVMPDQNVEITAHFIAPFTVSIETNTTLRSAWVWGEEGWASSAHFAESSHVNIVAAADGFDHWEVILGNVDIDFSLDNELVHGSFNMPSGEDVRIRAVYDIGDLSVIAPTIMPFDVPRGTVRVPYGVGGAGYRFFSSDASAVWTLTGTLPPGLRFNPFTGIITGTPTQAGIFSGLTIRTENSLGYDEKNFSIVIAYKPVWILRETPNHNILWNSIAYGNGMFVAFGASPGQSELHIMTSADGEEWIWREPFSLSFVPEISPWTFNMGNESIVEPFVYAFVTYDEARGVFVGGASRRGATQLVYSHNGITWHAAADEEETSVPGILHSDIAAGNGSIVVLGNTNTRGSNRPPAVLVSQNLRTWDKVFVPIETVWNGLWVVETRPVWWRYITFEDGIFYGTSGFITLNAPGENIPAPSRSLISSSDGYNWSFHAVANLFMETVTSGNDMLVGTRWNSAAFTSNSNWFLFNLATPGVPVVSHVAHIKDGIFVMTGARHAMAISPERNERVLLPVPEPFQNWSRVITNGNGRAVAIATTGANNQRAMTFDFRWITTDAEGNGTATANSTAAPGMDAFVVATPDAGHRFVRWEMSGGVSPIPISFSEVLEIESRMSAEFSTPSVSYGYAETSDGILFERMAPSEIGNVYDEYGANEGRESDYETENYGGFDFIQPHPFSEATIMRFVMPDEDVHITAIFEPIPPQQITINVQGGGSVTGNTEASPGTLVTLEPTPADGYIFVGWEGNVDISPDNTFIMPDGDVTIIAIFKQSFSVTVSSEATNHVIGSGNYTEGTIVNIFAGIRPCFRFNGWTTSSGVSFANQDRAYTSFIMPASGVTVTANWEAVVVKPGDVNGDGVINAADAALLTRFLLATDKIAFRG